MSQNKLLFLLITIISLIALISFGLSPFFQISEINFSGLELLSAEELNNLLKSYYLDNIIILDKSNIENRLLQSSYIKDVRVAKKYPNRLEIVIEERRPLAKINNNGEYLVFTADGFILENATRVRGVVPEIKGMGYSLKGNRIIYTPELEQVVQALYAIDRETVARLSLIQMDESGKVKVFAGSLPIFLGVSDELREKFRILHSILNKVKEDNLPYEYIDLSIIQRPVVKLKTK
jgi:cell division protein FtsQ